MSDTGTTDWHTLRDLLNRGFELLERGRIADAGECCKRALAIKPDLVQAHFLVGLVALEARDRRTALNAFGSCTKLDPGHAAAWAHLARLYLGDGQVNRADVAWRQAREHATDEPMVRDLLGTVASLMGEFDEAREEFAKAVEKSPRHVPFLLNYGNSLVHHGDTAGAIEIFERIIDIRPDTPQAHWALSGARKARDRSHVDQVRALVANGRRDPRALAFYWYGIGKELEDLEAWDEAFDAFEQGAAERRKTVEYDEPNEIAYFRFLEEHVTGDWFDSAPDGNPSAAPVFIVGQPRTGTTLVERIVTSHSDVHSAGELQQFGLAIRRLSRLEEPRRFTPAVFEAALSLNPRDLGDLYLDTTRRMQGTTPRFVDKLPQNYLYLPLILKALPNAKVLHLTRDPRDACFSSYKQLFADAYLHSYDQEEMARHHARYWQLMNTWRERFGGRFLDVSYEDTARDLEASARRVIAFLGLEWQDACLEFHRQKTAVSTASAVQVREPAHTRSIGRWRRHAHRLGPMLRALETGGVRLPGEDR